MQGFFFATNKMRMRNISKIEWLQRFFKSDSSKLMYSLVLNLSANTIDFTIGLLKTKPNKKVKFRSSGITRKLVLLIILV